MATIIETAKSQVVGDMRAIIAKSRRGTQRTRTSALLNHYPIFGFVVAGVGPVYITGLAEK